MCPENAHRSAALPSTEMYNSSSCIDLGDLFDTIKSKPAGHDTDVWRSVLHRDLRICFGASKVHRHGVFSIMVSISSVSTEGFMTRSLKSAVL